MEVRLTAHARLRLLEFGLSTDDIAEIIQRPDRERRGRTAIEADKVIGRQLWRVVYTVQEEFILVITVHPLED